MTRSIKVGITQYWDKHGERFLYRDLQRMYRDIEKSIELVDDAMDNLLLMQSSLRKGRQSQALKMAVDKLSSGRIWLQSIEFSKDSLLDVEKECQIT